MRHGQAKILFAALPGYGHVYPVMPLAQACVAAGHQVTLASGPPFLDRLPLPTVPQLSESQDLWWGEARCRVLRNEQQGPGKITHAVGALLNGVAERAAAMRIRDEIAVMPAPAQLISPLVALSETHPAWSQ